MAYLALARLLFLHLRHCSECDAKGGPRCHKQYQPRTQRVDSVCHQNRVIKLTVTVVVGEHLRHKTVRVTATGRSQHVVLQLGRVFRRPPVTVAKLLHGPEVLKSSSATACESGQIPETNSLMRFWS